MNKTRRRDLQNIITKIDILKEELEALRDEEQDYMDNIPENLQGSERYEVAEEAVDNMDNALDAFDEVIDSISETIG